MKKSILFISIFYLSLCGFSQQKTVNFPDDFLGIYKGTLTTNENKEFRKIKMEFHLKKRDSLAGFDYVLIYDGKPRNYTLLVKDKEQGFFEVNQNNGIILSTKFVDNTLYSFFEIQGNLLSSRFKFSKKELELEILFSKISDKRETGARKKKSPEAFNYPITKIQKATLNKVKSF